MATATLRIRCSKNVQDRLPRNAQQRANALIRRAVSRGADVGKLVTRVETPKRRPYTFLTVDSAVIGGGAHVEGHFGSDDDVFNILEGGSRPHRIPGAFGIPQGVDHPGTRPYRMLERAGPRAGSVVKAELLAGFPGVFGASP